MHLISCALWGSVPVFPERMILNPSIRPNSDFPYLGVSPVHTVTLNAMGYARSCQGACRHWVTLCLTFPATLCCIIGKISLTRKRLHPKQMLQGAGKGAWAHLAVPICCCYFVVSSPAVYGAMRSPGIIITAMNSGTGNKNFSVCVIHV